MTDMAPADHARRAAAIAHELTDECVALARALEDPKAMREEIQARTMTCTKLSARLDRARAQIDAAIWRQEREAV